jgi:hypothetical protein
MTDQELIRELINLKQREKPDHFTGSELSFPTGKRTVEVDGQRTMPFSLSADLEDGAFDAGGNLIGGGRGSDSDSSGSAPDEDSAEDDRDVDAKVAAAIARIIPLIEPDRTVTEALHHSADKPERLAALTALATELLFLGRDDIYAVGVDRLKSAAPQ